MSKNIRPFKKLIFVSVFLILGSAYFIFRPAGSTAQAQINGLLDSDYDGLTDQAERNVYHTDPFKADTDGDSYLDSAEVIMGSDPLNPRDPVDSLAATNTTTAQPAKSISSSLPWYITRAAGLAAYGLMFLVVILGTGMTTGYIYKYINPTKSWVIHKYLALALGLALLTHIIALFFDKFINFGWPDILIPFASGYKPVFLSLGILGGYLLLVIIFSSLFFRLRYKRTWRGIHYAVYLLFVFSFIHGVFIGTDSQSVGMWIIYWSTGLIILGLMIYRFVIRHWKMGREL